MEIVQFFVKGKLILVLIFTGVVPLILYFAMKFKIIILIQFFLYCSFNFQFLLSQNFLINQPFVMVLMVLSYWTIDISQTASYEITPVCLSVRLTICPSLKFLKIGSLAFSDILHDDT